MASHLRPPGASALERLRGYEKENKALVEQQDEFIQQLERAGRPTGEARGRLQQLISSLQLIRASARALEREDGAATGLAGATAEQASRGEAGAQPGVDLFTLYRVW